MKEKPPKNAPPDAPPPSARERFVLAASFLTGGAILALEIVGTRVISPYYGSSVYVWSALISVTLVSLSAGYWLGGLAADRRDPYACFLAEIFAGGLLIAAVPFLRAFALSATSPLGLKAGALASAVILFALPLAALSMTGPAAIRMVTRDVGRIGRGVGKVYAISTFGSLAGAILAGFWLIPHFPVRSILFALSGGLALLASAGLLFARPGAVPAGAAAAAALFWLAAPQKLAATNVVHFENSLYGELKVVDAQGQRSLFLNGTRNGVVRRDDFEPAATYFAYVNLLPALRPGAERALVIGLGAGITPRAFETRFSVVTDAVEIDPAVAEAARRYFDYRPRGEVAVEDGRTYLERSPRRYGFIVLDAFASEIPPFHLFSKEFFSLAAARMTEDGVLAVNTMARPSGEDARAWRSLYKTLKSAFPHVRLFCTEDLAALPDDSVPGFIFFASRSPLDLALARGGEAERAAFSEMLRREVPAPSEAELAGALLLADDYNPMDHLYRGVFVRVREGNIRTKRQLLLYDGRL